MQQIYQDWLNVILTAYAFPQSARQCVCHSHLTVIPILFGCQLFERKSWCDVNTYDCLRCLMKWEITCLVAEMADAREEAWQDEPTLWNTWRKEEEVGKCYFCCCINGEANQSVTERKVSDSFHNFTKAALSLGTFLKKLNLISIIKWWYCIYMKLLMIVVRVFFFSNCFDVFSPSH